MGPAFMVVSAVVSAAGAVASGIAASNQANYQAEVAKTNAEISKQKQAYIMQDYATKSAEMGLKQKAELGDLESKMAASGVTTTEGSSKGVLASQRAISKEEQLDYAKGSAQNWWAEATKQTGFEAQAKLDAMQAENARTTGYLKAGSSLLSSGSELNKNYGYFQDWVS